MDTPKEKLNDSPQTIDEKKLEEFISNSKDGGFYIHPELFVVIFPMDRSLGEFTVEKQVLFESIVDNILQQKTLDKFAITVVFAYPKSIDDKWKEYINLLTSSLNERISKNDEFKEIFNFVCRESDKEDFDYVLDFVKDNTCQQGKYVTFRTMSPVSWYPRHLYLHFSKFENKKSQYAWSISKVHICNRNEVGNLKSETLSFRTTFPKNKDEILLDEMCFVFPYIMAQNFNNIIEVKDGASLLHPYLLLSDAHRYKMSGFIPEEISVKAYVNYRHNKISVNKEKNSLKFE